MQAANAADAQRATDEGQQVDVLQWDGLHWLDWISIAVSPDRQWFAACGSGASLPQIVRKGNVRVWDVGTGMHVRTLQCDRGRGAVDVAWSPDGSMLAAAYLSATRLWDLATGATLHVLKGAGSM